MNAPTGLDPASLTIVSVDDHLVEPPEMFEGRLPSRFADRAPRVIERADGREMWLFEGVEIPNFGLNAVSGRPQEEYGIEPTRFDEIRRGCWDVDARIADMDAGGILASLNFPSFPQFCGQIFANTEEYWLSIPEHIRPHKDQPFYHLLAENEESSYVAYVSEQNLLADDTGQPIGHPQASLIFESFREGQYKLRPRISH